MLLLDEATSALDAESEHLVQAAIDDMLARGRAEQGAASMTVMIAAHRLSTVCNADKLFVIQEGQVVKESSKSNISKKKALAVYFFYYLHHYHFIYHHAEKVHSEGSHGHTITRYRNDVFILVFVSETRRWTFIL